MAKNVIRISSNMRKIFILSIAFIVLWVGQFFVKILSNKIDGDTETNNSLFAKDADASTCWVTPSVNVTNIDTSPPPSSCGGWGDCGGWSDCGGCGDGGPGSCASGGSTAGDVGADGTCGDNGGNGAVGSGCSGGTGGGSGAGSGSSDGGGSVGCSVGV